MCSKLLVPPYLIIFIGLTLALYGYLHKYLWSELGPDAKVPHLFRLVGPIMMGIGIFFVVVIFTWEKKRRKADMEDDLHQSYSSQCEPDEDIIYQQQEWSPNRPVSYGYFEQPSFEQHPYGYQLVGFSPENSQRYKEKDNSSFFDESTPLNTTKTTSYGPIQ